MLSSDVNTERNIMLREVDHACSNIIVQHMAYKASELLQRQILMNGRKEVSRKSFFFSITVLYICTGLNHKFIFHYSDFVVFINQCFSNFFLALNMGISLTGGKGKIHPITGHKGPEGEKTYSSTLPLTIVLDQGGWLTPCPRHYNPGKEAVATVQGAGWAPGPV